MSDEIDDDVFGYQGGMSQCISGFGNNAIDSLRSRIRAAANGEEFEGLDPEWSINELVRWCRAMNGEVQKLRQQLAAAEAKPNATAFITERFTVSRVRCERNTEYGFDSRDVYVAFSRVADVTAPVCIVTLDADNYVEWIEVDAGERRKGVATEVLSGIEKLLGSVELSGVSPEGEAFVEAFCKEEDPPHMKNNHIDENTGEQWKHD